MVSAKPNTVESRAICTCVQCFSFNGRPAAGVRVRGDERARPIMIMHLPSMIL
jgi:hypothetical protein